MKAIISHDRNSQEENLIVDAEEICPSGNSSSSFSSDKKLNETKLKVTQKRVTQTRYIRNLRILRADIRRRYGEMYLNTINSYDPKLIFRFFENFTAPDCTYRNQFVQATSYGETSKSSSLCTLPEKPIYLRDVIAKIARMFQCFPGSVSRLLNFEVRVRHHFPGSILTATVKTTGLFMYEIVRIHSEQQPTGSSSESPVVYFGPEHSPDRTYLSQLVPPIPIEIVSDIVMYLDENHKIRAFSSIPVKLQK